MSEQHKRSQRVGMMIQKELATLLVEGLKDPRVGFATITEVRMAEDLRNAKVFVSVYGTPEQAEQTLEGLRAATGFLKRQVAQRLKLRFAPELSFAYDDTLARSQRLESLLSAVSRGETETPNAEALEPLPVENPRVRPQHVEERVEQVGPRDPTRRSSRRRRRP